MASAGDDATGMDSNELEEYAESFSEFLGEINDYATKLVRESSRGPQNVSEHWEAFVSAIDWNETWIQALLAFHVFLFMFAVIFRKNVNIQTGIFLLVTILVAMSEFLNSYCADHWREFSSQNYFDKRGVFAGSIFAAPLLIIALFQLINFLIMSSSALVTAKRLELRRKRATQTSSASDTGEGSQQHEEVRAPLDGNKEKAARNRKRDGQTKKEK